MYSQPLQTLTMIKKILFTLILGTNFLNIAAAQSFPSALPVPGGIAIVDLKDNFTGNEKIYFQKKRVLVIKENSLWKAIVGLPLKLKAGIHKIQIVNSQGAKSTQEFSTHTKEYQTRHITIKNKRMVSPTKKDIERHYREKPLIVAALKTWTENNNVQTQFTIPVEGRFSSIFGLKRIYNKQKRIRRHTGLDIAAPIGTLIKSPAKGKVIRTGNYFFTGNTVFIDHGQGLITIYFHLDKTAVKAGQQLSQGDTIGTVGMTGRVSGPHLHWTVSLNNTKVDPKLFITTHVAKK